MSKYYMQRHDLPDELPAGTGSEEEAVSDRDLGYKKRLPEPARSGDSTGTGEKTPVKRRACEEVTTGTAEIKAPVAPSATLYRTARVRDRRFRVKIVE